MVVVLAKVILCVIFSKVILLLESSICVHSYYPVVVLHDNAHILLPLFTADNYESHVQKDFEGVSVDENIMYNTFAVYIKFLNTYLLSWSH